MPELPHPTQCHLWNLDHPTPQGEMELVKNYVDESHFDRALMRCRQCGQLYFYEWYEEIDWESGNDPSYATWIPVEEKDIDDLLKTDIWTIHTYTPRIINDWRRNGTRVCEWRR